MKIVDVTQSLVTEVTPNKISKRISVHRDVYDTLQPISGFGYIAGTGLNGKPAKFAVKNISEETEYVILLPAPKIKSQYLNLAAQILAFIWLDAENYGIVNINFSKINLVFYIFFICNFCSFKNVLIKVYKFFHDF